MTLSIRFWEWACAAVGAVIVFGMIGWLVYCAVEGAETPPELIVQVDEIRAQGDAFLVLVRARNDGGATAGKARIVGTLTRDGGAPETSALEFDYLPPRSRRLGGLLFSTDPRQGKLELRAESWVEP